jgi:hypothetical protein
MQDHQLPVQALCLRKPDVRPRRRSRQQFNNDIKKIAQTHEMAIVSTTQHLIANYCSQNNQVVDDDVESVL